MHLISEHVWRYPRNQRALPSILSSLHDTADFFVSPLPCVFRQGALAPRHPSMGTIKVNILPAVLPKRAHKTTRHCRVLGLELWHSSRNLARNSLSLLCTNVGITRMIITVIKSERASDGGNRAEWQMSILGRPPSEFRRWRMKFGALPRAARIPQFSRSACLCACLTLIQSIYYLYWRTCLQIQD